MTGVFSLGVVSLGELESGYNPTVTTPPDDAVFPEIVAKPSIRLIFAIEIYPVPPGLLVILPEDETTVEVSWQQLRVPDLGA